MVQTQSKLSEKSRSSGVAEEVELASPNPEDSFVVEFNPSDQWFVSSS